MTKTIGVLGCGWLGTPLAKSFLEEGHQVKGSTTSPTKLAALAALGINPYVIGLEEDMVVGDIAGFLKGVTVLIINIPPQLRKAPHSNFVKRIATLNSVLQESEVQEVVFISSTSVYGNVEGTITEETTPKPTTNAGKQLLAAEQLLMDTVKYKTTLIRFGGLIGPGRHPITFLSGKKGLKNGEELINLIHLNDCIFMIITIVKEGLWNTCYNGVHPYHPSKQAYYTTEAQKKGLVPPQYDKKTPKVYKKRIISRFFLTKKEYSLTSINV